MSLAKLLALVAVVLIGGHAVAADPVAHVPAEDVRVELAEASEPFVAPGGATLALLVPSVGDRVVGFLPSTYRYCFAHRLLRPPCLEVC
ncbi:MAG: hypothetical protein SFY70_02590 [Bacteroidia bacterium]|nr:hypothetical protein [Bacteroidia bacterium]